MFAGRTQERYVEDEIRHYNETVDKDDMAFPDALCENKMPLAANFLGHDEHKGKLHKPPFADSFFSVLAAIHGIDRRKLEQIDEKMRAQACNRCFLIAKLNPSMVAVVASMAGSVIGDERQNAITAPAG